MIGREIFIFYKEMFEEPIYFRIYPFILDYNRLYTVEPAVTTTLYNGHLSIVVTNEQSRPKFHDIEPVYSGHLLNAASGHPFLVPY